jgi:hypothetical protein
MKILKDPYFRWYLFGTIETWAILLWSAFYFDSIPFVWWKAPLFSLIGITDGVLAGAFIVLTFFTVLDAEVDYRQFYYETMRLPGEKIEMPLVHIPPMVTPVRSEEEEEEPEILSVETLFAPQSVKAPHGSAIKRQVILKKTEPLGLKDYRFIIDTMMADNGKG